MSSKVIRCPYCGHAMPQREAQADVRLVCDCCDTELDWGWYCD